MATLHQLKIKNFRGIESFEQQFNKGVICIIGRGDSGKTTILDAISLVLSSSWMINIYDSDFFNCNIEKTIEIEATLTDIPEKLLSKYCLYIRAIRSDGSILDDMESEEATSDIKTALTIKLTIAKDLEPIWSVVTDREQSPISISATDRGKLNVFYISEYTDKHFSLTKGNPLYSLFKELNGGEDEENNIILDVLRNAKNTIDVAISPQFETLISSVNKTTTALGLNTSTISTAVDHRDITMKDNKVCLHEDNIPLRLKGKGSKRLLSLAIQLIIANPNGIILIDEIEQGLEPDRVQHLVSMLKKYTNFQIFCTTHSRDVIVELPCSNIYIMGNEKSRLIPIPKDLQGCIRSNPEAFFAKKIIVCEGATEIGICRAFNEHRQKSDKKNFSCLGIRLTDGGGLNMIDRINGFHLLGYKICVLCDSDDKDFISHKENFKSAGITIIDCEDNKCIEQQFFTDLPWNAVIQLIEYRIINDKIGDKSIFDSVYSKKTPKPEYFKDWYKTEDNDLRAILGDVSKDKDWYKRIDHGEVIGSIIMTNWNNVEASKKIKTIFNNLTTWIDN